MHDLKLTTKTGSTNILVGEALPSFRPLVGDSQFLVVSDASVMAAHSGYFQELPSFVIPSGEAGKTLEQTTRIYDELQRRSFDKGDWLIAVGGGSVTDLVGFVAATYHRGVHFGSIPTTLLAQVDASVGGKNGINYGGVKNAIGVIRQSSFCYCDTTFLTTLSDREYYSGFAEIVKVAAILDAELFSLLESNIESIRAREPKLLETIIARAISLKIQTVEADESDEGIRRKLNFGHTIGHALEVSTSLSRPNGSLPLTHGEAVSIGMQLAAQMSLEHGILSQSESIRLRDLCCALHLPVELPSFELGEILSLILQDKKKHGSNIAMVLLERIGSSTIVSIPLVVLEKFLKERCLSA